MTTTKPALLEPVPPNAEGSTTCIVRWMVTTRDGLWLGAWDKEAFAAYTQFAIDAAVAQYEQGADVEARLGDEARAEVKRLRAALAEQPAPRVCKGIPRVGCNYLAECDSVCNKCGKVHAVHLIPGVGSTAPVERVALSVTDDMVSRFLSWPLPRDFYPDCGISFDGRRDDEWNKNKTWPIGTNLLTAIQARQMLEHVLGVAHGDME